MQVPIVIFLVLVIIGLATSGTSKNAAAPKSPTSTTAPTDTLASTSAARRSQFSPCERAGKKVEDYNVLAPGASRGEYLTLLHMLQRDCGSTALKLGLANDFLPQCKRLDQENCTMYRSGG